MEKQVRIKDTQSNNIESFTVSATTFGELKSELSDINFSGKRVVVRESRVTLQHKDAKLPDGDFTLYIMPEKTKAGNTLTDSQIDLMGQHELRKACVDRGLPANGRTNAAMREDLKAYVPSGISEPSSSNVSKAAIISKLKEVISDIEQMEDSNLPSYFDTIADDFEQVRRELNL